MRKIDRFLQWLYNELAYHPEIAKKIHDLNKKDLTNSESHGILIREGENASDKRNFA